MVELKLNLLRRAAFLIDDSDAFLKIYSRFYRTQDFVTRTKHTVEQAKLLVQQFIHSPVSGVVFVEKVHDYDIELLPVAMTTADALLDTLRIPGEVVIDHQIAELQVNAFGGCLSGDHNRGFIPEYSTRAARMSALGEPETRSVPACCSSQRR